MIKSYIITFELNDPTYNKAALVSEITKLSSRQWAEINKNTYFIKSTLNESRLFDKLATICTRNDSIFIAELSGKFDGYLDKKVMSYLKTYLY